MFSRVNVIFLSVMNLYNVDTSIAPALQANSIELEKAMKTHSLNKSIQDRTDVSDLYQQNILKSIFSFSFHFIYIYIL